MDWGWVEHSTPIQSINLKSMILRPDYFVYCFTGNFTCQKLQIMQHKNDVTALIYLFLDFSL